MTNVTPAVIKLTEDQAQALRLRAAGLTYRQIAEHQGIHEATAMRRVKSALAATLQEPADELRTLEAHRLDVLFNIAAEKAVTAGKGQMFAIDRCLAIMDRRAALLGLDAPQRRVVNVVTEDVIDQEIRRLEGELAQNDPEGAGVGDSGQLGEAGQAG